MNEIITWVMANQALILSVLTGVVAVASLVANATPNETDNKGVALLTKLINFLALNWKKKV